MEIGSLQPSEIRRSARQSGRRKHPESLLGNTYTSAFWACMVHLLEPPRTRTKLTAFFHGRASYELIRLWRFGRCAPPDWATDIMRHEIQKRVAEINALIEGLKKIPVQESPGIRGTRHLAAWRERKARERDEKEKAANAAALQHSQENKL